MRLANPAGLWFLLATVPVVVIHMLKPRRVEAVVSSKLLWRADTSGSTGARPWQRLPVTLPLLLQLIVVALLTGAFGDPTFDREVGLANHTVVVIDASASMGATDGSPDRLADAKTVALGLWDQRPESGRMSVVVADTHARVLASATEDQASYESAVRSIRLSDGPGDLDGAMALAEGLETPAETIGIVLISDGGHSATDLAALPAGVTHHQVGADASNRAITSLDVVESNSGLVATAVVESTGGPAASGLSLRFDVDGLTRHVETIDVSDVAPTVVSVDLPHGTEVIARLGGEDLLAIDDTAYATASQQDDLRIAIEGDPDAFFSALIDSLPGVGVVDPEVETPDVTVLLGVPVPDDIARPFLAVVPPGGAPGVTVDGMVEAPIPTLVRTTHPLLAGLDLSGLRIVEAQSLEAPAAETLVGAEGAPLIVRGSRGGLPFIYVAFDFAQSNLPLDVSFPVLGERMVVELADATTVAPRLEVGDPLDTPAGRSAVVTDPSGASRDVPLGAGSLTVDRPGFWIVEPEGGASKLVAVSLPDDESKVAPLPVAATAPRDLRSGEEPPSRSTSFRWLLIAVAVAVAVAELLVSRRRVGVGSGQWRFANALRVAAAVVAVMAMIGVTISRDGRSVATVFVLDRSDSVGDTGRSDGIDVVSEALEGAPGGARIGVIAAGDGARVERLLGDVDRVDRLQSVVVDTDNTDLAAGLRLAGAVLTDDTRRRIVVVSDGRPTIGDAAAEAARLADRGVQIDYIPISVTDRTDASVVSVAGPDRVAEGEAVALTATVESTAAQPALVTLRRNGEVADTADVMLRAGRTSVTLRDETPGGGLASYDISVDVALDDRPQNDVARTAVEIEGPAGVLVVEGSSGSSDTLINGLASGGLDVNKIGVLDLPSLDRLAAYDSIVLVDVDAQDLSALQMSAIVAATRDLGIGLVTVGGPQSYGMGEYRDSLLESVLPVVSDVLDPRRRRTVAQVLAIDTSESMGECHCAEGFSDTSRLPVGVTKTDIARTGAVRAIDALHADDEVGVLGIDTEARWLIDLQQVPSADVVSAGLSTITPAGQTDLSDTLTTAAEALRESNAGLKHIILFSDGFTQPAALARLADDAADLLAEGITVSVVATGEGAARELEPIAVAGGGRFYPGRDLTRVPEILVQESVIASRSFINEGEFLPTVTGVSAVTSGLDATPSLFGFVATTAQPSARTLLTIGDEDDPLLATWQAGLGRSTAWTSDAGFRWGQAWVDWDGYVDFWSTLVRDTFPQFTAGSVRTVVDGDELRIVADAADETAGRVDAVVTDPVGVARTIQLARTAGGTFEGTLRLEQPGAHAVSASVITSTGASGLGADVASLSYSAEYRPGGVDRAVLQQLSDLTGGRGEIEAGQAFDEADLAPGRRVVVLSTWLLALAAALWLAAIVLSRLWLRRRVVVGGTGVVVSGSSEPDEKSAPPTIDDVPAPPVPEPEEPKAAESASTVNALLKSKRDRK